MIELTRDEALALLDELSQRPYRDVQVLIIMLANKISELEGPKEFQEAIYTGEE